MDSTGDCYDKQDVYRGFGVILGVERGGLEPVPIYEDSPLRESFYIHRKEDMEPEDDQWHYYEKLLVERTLSENLECPVTILRLPGVYGPGDPQHRLYTYVKRMVDRRPVVIVQSKLGTLAMDTLLCRKCRLCHCACCFKRTCCGTGL